MPYDLVWPSLNSNLPHGRHRLLLGAHLIMIKHIEGDCSRGDCFLGLTHFVLNPNPNPTGDCNNRRHLPKPYDPYWSQPRSEASSPKPFKRCQHHIAGVGLLQAVSTCGYWHRHVSATHVRVVCPQTDWQPSDFSVGDEKWSVQPTSGNKNGPETPQSYERKTPQGIMGKSKALTGPRDVREDKERWRQSQIRGQ